MPDMLKAAMTCKNIIEKKNKVEIRAIYGGKTVRQLHGEHILPWDKIHAYNWV
jgi:hypothetical protein